MSYGNFREISSEKVFEHHGCFVFRSVLQRYDPLTGKNTGRREVLYDVCDDEDLYASYCTLRDAKKECMYIGENYTKK